MELGITGICLAEFFSLSDLFSLSKTATQKHIAIIVEAMHSDLPAILILIGQSSVVMFEQKDLWKAVCPEFINFH